MPDNLRALSHLRSRKRNTDRRYYAQVHRHNLDDDISRERTKRGIYRRYNTDLGLFLEST